MVITQGDIYWVKAHFIEALRRSFSEKPVMLFTYGRAAVMSLFSIVISHYTEGLRRRQERPSRDYGRRRASA